MKALVSTVDLPTTVDEKEPLAKFDNLKVKSIL